MKICGTFSNMEEALKLCRKELSNFQIPSKIELVDETEVFSVEKKKKKFLNCFSNQDRLCLGWEI